VGCGQSRDKSILTRFVLVDGRVEVDPDQRRPGRGAYACDRACFERACARGGFARSFRRAVHIDPDLLHSS
jgi:predicted RNA-binding protein YlxR (DUF448 family)